MNTKLYCFKLPEAFAFTFRETHVESTFGLHSSIWLFSLDSLFPCGTIATLPKALLTSRWSRSFYFRRIHQSCPARGAPARQPVRGPMTPRRSSISHGSPVTPLRTTSSVSLSRRASRLATDVSRASLFFASPASPSPHAEDERSRHPTYHFFLVSPIASSLAFSRRNASTLSRRSSVPRCRSVVAEWMCPRPRPDRCPRRATSLVVSSHRSAARAPRETHTASRTRTRRTIMRASALTAARALAGTSAASLSKGRRHRQSSRRCSVVRAAKGDVYEGASS